MSAQSHTAQDDLSFMRGLVEAGDNASRTFGEIYLAAGLIYGAQMLLHAGQLLGLLSVRPLAALAIGLGPTVIFLAVLTWLLWRRRRVRPAPVVERAVAAVFQSVGLANLALVAVIGAVAWRHHSLAIWLIYPCSVFVLQGVAWMVAFALRRRAWLAWVGLGWMAAGVAMGLAVDSLAYFILIGGVAFLLLMVAPGATMIRLARTAA
ncbi:MAG TPA: hypothetical protein VII63_03775 [Caulobacteraceae bacterium]